MLVNFKYYHCLISKSYLSLISLALNFVYLILSSINYEHLMNFLLFCAFDCGLCLSVIQLTTTASSVYSINSITTNDTIDGLLTMPVTTRSQAKLLTGSTTGLLTVPPKGSNELLDNSLRFTEEELQLFLHLPFPLQKL